MAVPTLLQVLFEQFVADGNQQLFEDNLARVVMLYVRQVDRQDARLLAGGIGCQFGDKFEHLVVSESGVGHDFPICLMSGGACI